jgi:hypothetical protein
VLLAEYSDAHRVACREGRIVVAHEVRE